MSGLNRFLSRLDKGRTSHEKDSSSSQPAFYLHGLFQEHDDNASNKSGDKDIETKVKSVRACLADAGPRVFNDSDISYVLGSSYACGDPLKAYELLNLLDDSEHGGVKKCDPNIKLLGAVNRGFVTCYLDSILFAMFARLESFEAILFKSFEDEKRKRLATLLRLWVNTVRTGKLVTIGITKQLQDCLAACGWRDAALPEQQDASEAFSFITETLQLPMLALKMDIFHTGKEDAKDDHKIVKERLLDVAIPEQPDDATPITLEACLETYLNSRVEVKRLLERRATLSSVRSRDSSKAAMVQVEQEPVDSQPSTPSTNPSNALPPYALTQTRPSSHHHRSPSIIQEYSALEDEKKLEINTSAEQPRAKSIRKEVLMPAWQFFSLIPWYTAPACSGARTEGLSDASPAKDEQVAAHFRSNRPVLGICLKRYAVNKEGVATRRSTYIDVPTEIGFPHFIHDTIEGDGVAFGNFKLSLQSVVCHRGTSVHAGHYVSLVRGNDAPDNPDGWLLFDDLAKDNRVKYVNISQALRDESPYLLFYQVQPIEGDNASLSGDDRPPSYASESDRRKNTLVPCGSSDMDNSGILENGARGRPSLESVSSDKAARGRSIDWSDLKQGGNSDRSQYEAFKDTNGHLAVSAPVSLSRKSSKKIKGAKAFSANQNGEKRLSASFTRFTDMITGVARSDLPLHSETEEYLSSDANAVMTPDFPAKIATVQDEAKAKKTRRGKSKDKNWGSNNVPRKTFSKTKPDRECLIM